MLTEKAKRRRGFSSAYMRQLRQLRTFVYGSYIPAVHLRLFVFKYSSKKPSEGPMAFLIVERCSRLVQCTVLIFDQFGMRTIKRLSIISLHIFPYYWIGRHSSRPVWHDRRIGRRTRQWVTEVRLQGASDRQCALTIPSMIWLTPETNYTCTDIQVKRQALLGVCSGHFVRVFSDRYIHIFLGKSDLLWYIVVISYTVVGNSGK